MIRHIVALRFRAGTPQETKLGLYRDLAALAGHIDGIIDFRHFENVSVETELVRGATICSGSISAMWRCATPILRMPLTRRSARGSWQSLKAELTASLSRISRCDAC